MNALRMSTHDEWESAVRAAGEDHDTSGKKYRVSLRRVKHQLVWGVYTLGKIKDHR